MTHLPKPKPDVVHPFLETGRPLVSVLRGTFFAFDGKHVERGGQIKEQDHQHRHDAQRRVKAEFANRHDIGGIERTHADCGRQIAEQRRFPAVGDGTIRRPSIPRSATSSR